MNKIVRKYLYKLIVDIYKSIIILKNTIIKTNSKFVILTEQIFF